MCRVVVASLASGGSPPRKQRPLQSVGARLESASRIEPGRRTTMSMQADASDGAASFYLLVLLTAFLAAMVPIAIARAVKGRFSMPLVACCGIAAFAWSRVHPEAVAWADASSVFDPYEILGVPSRANATVVRRAYRSLSRLHHPDKGGDPKKFRLLAQAHDALNGDAKARANYAAHGHPDGPRPVFAGIALPNGSQGTILCLYFGLLILAVVPVVRAVRGPSAAATRRARKETVLALRDTLLDKDARPRTVSGWLSLLGAVIDDYEDLDVEGTADVDAATMAAAKQMDGGKATPPKTPTGALLLRRATATEGRRLDEAKVDAAAEVALSLGETLARVALDLALSVGWAQAALAVTALQRLCAGPPVRDESAAISRVTFAVYDDDEPLPDLRSGDVATCTVTATLPPGQYFLILGHAAQNQVKGCRPFSVADAKTLDVTTQVKLPERTGKYVLAVALRAVEGHVDLDATKPYKVEPQVDSD